jgi:hypothetical protein
MKNLPSAFPDPVSPLLALIARDALEGYQSGEIDIGGAILHAVVNGWYESHIEGEECGGCPKYPATQTENIYVSNRADQVTQPSIEQTLRPR